MNDKGKGVSDHPSDHPSEGESLFLPAEGSSDNRPVPASADLVASVAKGICCPNGCMAEGTDRICAAGGFEPQARSIIPIAQADEREACAKLAETQFDDGMRSVRAAHYRHAGRSIATAIRERNGQCRT